MEQSSQIVNRRVNYDYQLGSKVIAGIALTGVEVGNIRHNRISLKQAFVSLENDQVWLKNLMTFTSLKESTAGMNKHRLLLTKPQIKSLQKALSGQYNTIIITRLLLGRYIKIEIAPAKGRKKYDKREALKKRDNLQKDRRRLKGEMVD
ncbi:MAG: SsrA-binding protein [Candidatus Saccharibacteria bacterium]|nr:SsrA-binding protein [Candidatus Saccharibacteria bacterium]MCY4010760.1 SsrA-binding protein [Candidatus Saccharibacteria bacterium]MCY4089128.1 SsrA-binding protein [Candidatus Saccharibacteria bacterium]